MSHVSLPASLSVDRKQGSPGGSESCLGSQPGGGAKSGLSAHRRKGDRKTESGVEGMTTQQLRKQCGIWETTISARCLASRSSRDDPKDKASTCKPV